MTVEQLTQPWAATRRLGALAEVTAVTCDSRQVTPGAVFVAIPGFQADGHQYLPQAVAAGAVAVVYSQPGAGAGFPATVTTVVVEDSRRALAELAADFWGDPSAALTLVGVTGTNGKTTIAHLVDALARAAGRTTGIIGTLGIALDGEELPGTHTTPDAAQLQALLARMRERGVTHVSMEVSSHGLALDRVWRCKFDAVLFTNLTQDHLDFHGDAEDYYRAKRRLFTEYVDLARPEKEPAGVINVDDPAGARLAGEARGRVVTYGFEQAAELAGRELVSTAAGLRFAVTWPGRAEPVRLGLSLIGRFNAYNALAAVAAGYALGYAPELVQEALGAVRAVPGRFERVDVGQDFTVVVDYAHTPDAVENVLRAARALEPARVLCVLGCGGDRDRTKRPRMARLATELADATILTSDNPRTEDPQAILQDMLAGVSGTAYTVIPDRREAIHAAVASCRPKDLLVIAGKGHETYQIVGTQVLPFDDREVARAALRARRDSA